MGCEEVKGREMVRERVKEIEQFVVENSGDFRCGFLVGAGMALDKLLEFDGERILEYLGGGENDFRWIKERFQETPEFLEEKIGSGRMAGKNEAGLVGGNENVLLSTPKKNPRAKKYSNDYKFLLHSPDNWSDYRRKDKLDYDSDSGRVSRLSKSRKGSSERETRKNSDFDNRNDGGKGVPVKSNVSTPRKGSLVTKNESRGDVRVEPLSSGHMSRESIGGRPDKAAHVSVGSTPAREQRRRNIMANRSIIGHIRL